MTKRKRDGNLTFRKNKKGNVIFDTVLVVVLLFSLALGSFYGYYILNKINVEFQANPDLVNETKTAMADSTARYPSLFDGIFVFAMIGIWGVTLIGAFMIDSHPVFFIFSILALIFILVVAANLSNVYQTIVADPDLSTLSAAFPMTNYLINHFVELIVIIGFSIGATLFAKSTIY